MHHGLRVHHHLDLIIRNVEEEVSFEHFETLVHHGGRVDGNLLAHAPHRVIQGVCHGDVFKLFNRPFAEGAAGRRDFEEFHFMFALAAFEALEDSAMFRINRRNEGLRIFGKLVPNDRACHDHGFFVRKSHMLAMFDSGNGREASHGAHQRVDDDIGLRVGSEFAKAFHAHEHLHAEYTLEFLGGIRVEHAHAFHLVLAHDFGNLRHAAVCGNGIKIEDIGMLVNDIYARSTDRTGRTEKNYVFHFEASFLYR